MGKKLKTRKAKVARIHKKLATQSEALQRAFVSGKLSGTNYLRAADRVASRKARVY